MRLWTDRHNLAHYTAWKFLLLPRYRDVDNRSELLWLEWVVVEWKYNWLGPGKYGWSFKILARKHEVQ